MTLKGDLKSLSLANVLQDLAQNETTGTLKLEAPDRKRYFWFEKGALRLVGLGDSRGPSLINGLLATGKVTLADAGSAARAQTDFAMVRAMLKSGRLKRDDVKAALEQQMMELACDVFLWTDASFEFSQGDPTDDNFETSQVDFEPRLACDMIIMEALRRIDEWPHIKKAILSPREIYASEPGRSTPQVDPLTARIHTAIDGERRLQDVMDMTHLGQFNVFKAVASLRAAGFIRPLTPDESFAKGKAALEQKRAEVALNLAQYALERQPNHPELRRLAALALEALDRKEEAAAEYRVLAASQVEPGQVEQAITTCRKILALAPRDSFTQDRLFQLLLQAGRREEALAQGEGLAAAYKRAGLPDKAREVYTRMMSALGDSDELVEHLADIARHLGDKKEAVALYRKLFDRASARGDEEQVIQLSRTLLRLDPGLEDIAKKRMEIETGVYAKRKQRARRIRIIAISSVAAVVLLAAGGYEFLARSTHGRILADTITLMDQKDYQGILRAYDRLRKAYPLAIVQITAHEERSRVEGLFFNQQLAVVTKLEAERRLPEAVREGETLAELSLVPDHKARAEAMLQDLRRKRSAEENKFMELVNALAKEARETGAQEPLDRLSGINDPLALPALRECLQDKLPAVRRAAVAALNRMEAPEVPELLIRAMAADTDATVTTAIAQSLKQRTGESFTTAREWDEWLRRQAGRPGVAAVVPLQALLGAPAEPAVAGKSLRVRWELINVGARDAEFTLPREFGPLFKGTGPAGPVTQKTPASIGVDRLIRLRPGELIGGTVDLAPILQGMAEPGSYRISWTGMVRWETGASTAVESLPLILELSK